jgi:hypothetical protein
LGAYQHIGIFFEVEKTLSEGIATPVAHIIVVTGRVATKLMLAPMGCSPPEMEGFREWAMLSCYAERLG